MPTGAYQQGHARSSRNRDVWEEMFPSRLQRLEDVDTILLDSPQEDGFTDSSDQTLHDRQGETPQPGAAHIRCQLVDARAEDVEAFLVQFNNATMFQRFQEPVHAALAHIE